jgi:hypothetical protein
MDFCTIEGTDFTKDLGSGSKFGSNPDPRRCLNTFCSPGQFCKPEATAN